MGFRTETITVHGSHVTISILRTHIFNWKIWPDFNTIPNVTKPFLLYNELQLVETLSIKSRKFKPLLANHVVAAVGYHIDSGEGSLVFTGDITTCDALWQEVNKISNLKYLIIETAFSNSELVLAKLFKHLCPFLLMTELAKLEFSNKVFPEVYVTHLKPGESEIIIREILARDLILSLQALKNHQVLQL